MRILRSHKIKNCIPGNNTNTPTRAHVRMFEEVCQCSASVRVYFSVPVEVLSSELGSMSLLQYFQQTGIGEQATTEANAAAAEEIGNSGNSNSRKRKCYTALSDEDRAAIGRHATKNSNVSIW